MFNWTPVLIGVGLLMCHLCKLKCGLASIMPLPLTSVSAMTMQPCSLWKTANIAADMAKPSNLELKWVLQIVQLVFAALGILLKAKIIPEFSEKRNFSSKLIWRSLEPISLIWQIIVIIERQTFSHLPFWFLGISGTSILVFHNHNV